MVADPELRRADEDKRDVPVYGQPFRLVGAGFHGHDRFPVNSDLVVPSGIDGCGFFLLDADILTTRVRTLDIGHRIILGLPGFDGLSAESVILAADLTCFQGAGDHHAFTECSLIREQRPLDKRIAPKVGAIVGGGVTAKNVGFVVDVEVVFAEEHDIVGKRDGSVERALPEGLFVAVVVVIPESEKTANTSEEAGSKDQKSCDETNTHAPIL